MEWRGYSVMKKITIVAGAFLGTVAVCTSLYAGFSYLRTEPEAVITATFNKTERGYILAEIRKQKYDIAEIKLKNVREEMRTVKLTMVRTRNRTGLSAVEKEESLISLNEDLHALELAEKCYESGRINCLEDE